MEPTLAQEALKTPLKEPELPQNSPELCQIASTPVASDETKQIKALLSEARNTRDMLVGFRSAVETGTYHGGKMLDIAKGLAFMEAIMQQNQAHLRDLQERLDTAHG